MKYMVPASGPCRQMGTVPFSAPLGDEPAIHLEGVSKAYRRGAIAATVLRGINLTVRRGQWPRSRPGLPAAARPRCCRSSVASWPPMRDAWNSWAATSPHSARSWQRTLMRRDRIGFVFQRFHLIRGLTALENVCVPMTLQGIANRAASFRALDAAGGGGAWRPGARSSPQPQRGQRQRAVLARRWPMIRNWFWPTKPTASLDAKSGQEAMELLRRLVTEQGKTAVRSDPRPPDLSFADHIHWLENGQIVESGVQRQRSKVRDQRSEVRRRRSASPLARRETGMGEGIRQRSVALLTSDLYSFEGTKMKYIILGMVLSIAIVALSMTIDIQSRALHLPSPLRERGRG